VRIGAGECVIDVFDPGKKMGGLGDGAKGVCAEKGKEQAKFGLERKGRNAAEDKASDEDGQPEADAAQVVEWLHEYSKSKLAGCLRVERMWS